jgi:hypothetical protein
VNCNNTSCLHDGISFTYELADNLVCWVSTIIEIKLEVLNPPLLESRFIIKWIIKTDDKFDIVGLEILETVEERLWQLPL